MVRYLQNASRMFTMDRETMGGNRSCQLTKVDFSQYCHLLVRKHCHKIDENIYFS